MPWRLLPVGWLVATLALAGGARADSFEPNDTVAEAAGPLPSGTPVESWIHAADDLDFFYFDANKGPLTITLTGIPEGTDYDLFLVDEVGNELDFSENLGNEPERIDQFVFAAGRFYVKVAPIEGFSDTEPYALTATFTPPAALAVDSTSVTAGSTVAVAIALRQDEPVASVAVTIAFDAARLVPRAVAATARAAGFVADADFSTTGEAHVTLTAGEAPLPAGDGAILTLDFTARTAASGNAALVVASAAAADTAGRNLILDVADGEVAIAPVVPDLALAVPETLSAPPGTQFTVPMTFTNNVPVSALRFTLHFDPTAVAPIRATPETRMAGFRLTAEASPAGTIVVALEDTTGVPLDPGEGLAMTFEFLARADATGNASLSFTDAGADDALGDPLAVATAGTQVTAVRDVALAAVATDAGLRVTWTADADAGHLGFRLLRDDVPLHDGLLEPATRAFTDASTEAGRRYRYTLEALDRAGGVQRFGPLLATGIGPVFHVGIPFPNPMRAETALQLAGLPAGARVEIVDAAGRLVRRLDAPGTPTAPLVWDGRRDDGAGTAAGVYFFRIVAGGPTITRRIVKLSS